MSAQHTPGPWLAAAARSSIVGLPVVSPAAMGRSICNVTDHDECQANARLIAAAPDMLDALKQARARIIALTSGIYVPAAVNAAIASAEGRDND